MFYLRKINLSVLLVLLTGIFCNCFAADPWKVLQKVQDVSKTILAVTQQDIAVPETYSCVCEIKGDLSGKIKEITGGTEDVLIKKYYKQHGNVCNITLHSETKAGQPYESAELKMALNPLTLMLKKITAAERLNAIAGITFIANFEIDKLKELYDTRPEKVMLNNMKVNKLTLTNRYAGAMERSYIKEWIIWVCKKNLLRKMYIVKVIKSKTGEQIKEDTIVSDSEYVYSKHGKYNLPVEVFQPQENMKTTINYEPRDNYYLVSAMDFYRAGEQESSMSFTYKQYEGYFMPVKVLVSGKEKVKISCDYTKVLDYFLPGYESLEFESHAPVEIKYFEYSLERPVIEDAMADVSRETVDDWRISIEDFYEQTYTAIRDDEQR
ncbi:MAG: hypothetical protein AB1633_06635 [Elusimicrobiota bacterium]